MININKVTLVGRLTKDVELRKTPSNVSVCQFTIAVNRRFEKDKADFINCVAWRQSAEFLSKYAAKGMKISVEGAIQTRDYEKDGKKVYITEIIADSVQLDGNKQDHPQDLTYTEDNANTTMYVDEIGEDDLPFE